jgi:hypothetical protein
MMSLKKNYERILARERLLAGSVARSAIKPKPIGAWDMMIPLVFFINFMKNKGVRELFIQNYLFTKKLALEAAFALIKEDATREDVRMRVEKETSEALKSDDKGIYSNEIRLEQLKEIDLLMDHYCLLLAAEGSDYADLIKAVYQNRNRYLAFLEALTAIEKRVAGAAQLTLGDQADMTALSRLENATMKFRMAEVDRIFKP